MRLYGRGLRAVTVAARARPDHADVGSRRDLAVRGRRQRAVAAGAGQCRSLDHAAAVSCAWPRAASALTATCSPQPGYPVGAATSAGEDVVDALDGDVGAQHGPEYREFRTAETLASRRRR